MEELRVALWDLETKHVRYILDEYGTQINLADEGCCLLHDMIVTVSDEVLLSCPQRRTLMHMLTNAGLNVNAVDENGETALHLAVRLLGGDVDICEPLLQAGADQGRKNAEGRDVESLVETQPEVTKTVKELFSKYKPGLWDAVDKDDILSVRKLVNLWCRVDIMKDGKSLKELALDRGTENIIRLIKEIMPSMHLAHYVMADDVSAVRKLYEERSDANINTEFRNLGDMGATPLFYAISHNNVSLVELLVEHGAKRDALITLDDEDVPILFAALNAEMDPEVIKRMVPHKDGSPIDLVALHYRGQFVLHHCVESGVPLSAVRHILQRGYSQLLALRDVHNRCPRDLAVKLGKHEYVKVFDEAVHDWYLDNDGEHRRLLAVMGYTHMREAQKDGVRACDVVQTMETSSPQAQFDTQLLQYQEQTARLAMAVECGDMEGVRNNLYFKTEHPDSFHTCLAQCRPKGDGQPLLHKAVLHGHLDVTEHLVKVIRLTLKLKVDDIRDQCLRTALHYAYCMETGRALYELLQDHGASDFTMDKDCRSPLAFKHLKQHPEMAKLLQWHKDQKYDRPEPDPWSVKLPRRPSRKACHPGHPHCHGPQPVTGGPNAANWTSPSNPWMQGPPGNTYLPPGGAWGPGAPPGGANGPGLPPGWPQGAPPGSQWQQGPPGNTWPQGPPGNSWAAPGGVGGPQGSYWGPPPGMASQQGSYWAQGTGPPPGMASQQGSYWAQGAGPPPGWAPVRQTPQTVARSYWSWMTYYCNIL